MKNNNLFWSYAGQPDKDSIIIEHILKYADVDLIKDALNTYGTARCKEVWEKNVIPDKRLNKLNHFLAKFIFKISMDDKSINKYFMLHQKSRADKIDEIFNR